jgi:hypothetical protein
VEIFIYDFLDSPLPKNSIGEIGIRWFGRRIDPPMSLPISRVERPAEMAAAPPELPPGVRLGSFFA